MKEALRLGFVPSIRSTISISERLARRITRGYVSFLQYDHPQGVFFGYKFTTSDSGEHWEGQIEEFALYADEVSIFKSILSFKGVNLLPIGSDAGGNAIVLNVDSDQSIICDLNYSSGVLSEISPSFHDFLASIYVID